MIWSPSNFRILQALPQNLPVGKRPCPAIVKRLTCVVEGSKVSPFPEAPSRRRSHLLLARQRQSDADLPASRRLSADVGLARSDAAPLGLASPSVRHHAPAADQARRPHRDPQQVDPPASATQFARLGDPRLCPRQAPQAGHISAGACAPPSPHPSNHSASPSPRPQAPDRHTGASARLPNARS